MATLMNQNKKLFYTMKELSENKENTSGTRNKHRKNQSAIRLTDKPWIYCQAYGCNQKHKSSQCAAP